MEIGDPMVFPCRTPLKICAESVSIRILPPRPYPRCRRQSSRLKNSWSTVTPAGIPLNNATSASPWLSPAVENRNIRSQTPRRIVTKQKPADSKSANFDCNNHCNTKPLAEVLIAMSPV